MPVFAGLPVRQCQELVRTSVVRGHQPRPLLEDQQFRLDAHIDYFDYFAASRLTALTANCTLAGDPIVQAIIHDELVRLRGRMQFRDVEPARGLEPLTFRLQGGCSAN